MDYLNQIKGVNINNYELNNNKYNKGEEIQDIKMKSNIKNYDINGNDKNNVYNNEIGVDKKTSLDNFGVDKKFLKSNSIDDSNRLSILVEKVQHANPLQQGRSLRNNF